MTIKEIAEQKAEEYQKNYIAWCKENPGKIMHGDSSKVMAAELAKHCETLSELSALLSVYHRKAETTPGVHGFYFFVQAFSDIYSEYLKQYPEAALPCVLPENFYNYCMKLMSILYPKLKLDTMFDGFSIDSSGVLAQFSSYHGCSRDQWAEELPAWAFEIPLHEVQERKKREESLAARLQEEEAIRLQQAAEQKIAEEEKRKKEQEYELYKALKLKFDGNEAAPNK